MVSTACKSSAAEVAVEVSAAERTSAANCAVFFLLIFFNFLLYLYSELYFDPKGSRLAKDLVTLSYCGARTSPIWS